METNNQEETVKSEKPKKQSNAYFISKVVINLMLILIGVMAIGAFLRNIQTRTSLVKQQSNSELALEEVATILDKNSESKDDLTKVYHDGNWLILSDIEQLFDNGFFGSMIHNEPYVRSLMFEELSSQSGLPYLYLLSPEGKIVVSPDVSQCELNPAATGHMTQENLNRILAWCRNEDGTITPEFVRNQYGTYYFYSRPYTFEGEIYTLTVGLDSTVLDVRISSLDDVETVLSRMAIINKGFLFAVSKTDNLFLYYKDGDNLLTGQNALSTGLTEEILQDGYKGVQTILGEKYYCVSKTVKGDVAIVAASRYNTVISHDKYVLVWSVMEFSMVMILCLVYAIIVRNDFVRRAVKTERVVLRKDAANPIYFDKSVFNKVMPLMLIGVLAVYGITFYMQTLLEIAEGIDKSNVVLQEVIARYEESLDSRKIVEDYYSNRFLSTAKLVTFITEENPEILNAASPHYHTTYDKDGNRQYILDNEGNHLKSVSESPILQRICEENRIDAIYLFDENGHTIATNTKNWFFTISRNPEDQSYAFRDVLDGKLDHYLQSGMTDDLGEEAQFFGVVFHYYTTVDEAGNTVYVSRYAYEEAANAENAGAGNTAGGITRHRALLQIELDQELTQTILSPMDADYVLSTKVLDDGAIVMFDNSREHLCVYSPVQSSIGRSAEELGVTSKAFTGADYYGFNRVNGVNYFQFYRYLNDYYIATAIPKTSMFTSRAVISFITAGVCLVLIIILLMTVTVTNKEEEELYEIMGEDPQPNKLNSVIFSIILPSGRVANTTQAQARWDNRRIPWNERSPEMKLALMLGWIAAVMILYFVLSAVGIRYISTEESVISYIMSGGWERGFNIFALSACIMVLAMTVIAIELFRIPVRLSTALLGTRGETVGHLLLSVVKYGGTITALFYCLYLVGIDSANLLASAGILSLVIGLGAQSLIKDIIAGIFIVFEGEFRVGDIVTISDFRGTVTDIGLRTTKIKAMDGNVKIFNNSDISGVLNMTKETSVAAATISVEYGQDIDYVDAVLARELPLLKEKNPKILDGPTSLGVSSLGDSGISYTVIAKCTEQNVRGVNRYLMRELLQIFYRNGINVPFPNVTVSQLDMTGRKTMKDLPPEDSDQKQEAGK